MGVEAALLAADGFTANDSIFETPRGYVATLFGDDFEWDALLGGLGEQWNVQRHGFNIKRYPAQIGMQWVTECVVLLREKNGLRADDVEWLELEVPAKRAVVIQSRGSRPASPASSAIEYCAAVALTQDHVGIDSFTDAVRFSAPVEAALKKIRLKPNPDIPTATTDDVGAGPRGSQGRQGRGRALRRLPGLRAQPHHAGCASRESAGLHAPRAAGAGDGAADRPGRRAGGAQGRAGAGEGAGRRVLVNLNGRTEMKVGSNGYTYELVEDFAKLPEGETFGLISRLTTDSEDRLYVFQRKDPAVRRLRPRRKIPEIVGNRRIQASPWVQDRQRSRLPTDQTDNVAMVYTLDGKLLKQLGTRGQASDTGCEDWHNLPLRAAGPFNHPTELMPGPSGDLYVTDGYRNSRVHRFSKDGELIQSWGRRAKTRRASSICPTPWSISPDGTLYVSDRANSRIQIFSPDGKFIGMWTGMGGPNDMARDKNGIFYVLRAGDRRRASRPSACATANGKC